jgi:glutamate/tyrosine decarboxylase-like PLP-dependent enzyme
VRDTDFEKQLHERLELAEHEKQRAIELAETKSAGELQKAAAAKDSEIQALKAKLDAGEVASRSAVELAEAKLAAKLHDQLAEKAAEVERLKASIRESDQAKQLAVIEATTRVEKERDRLKADLELAEAQKALGEKALHDKYETQIKDRDDAIERLKDMKAKLSTKMVGETLTARAA